MGNIFAFLEVEPSLGNQLTQMIKLTRNTFRIVIVIVIAHFLGESLNIDNDFVSKSLPLPLTMSMSLR